MLQSPALQDRKEKDRMLLTLKSQLDDEQNEKAEVLEENESLKEQLKRLREQRKLFKFTYLL